MIMMIQMHFADTLCSSRLIDFIRQKNILVWAGDVHASEAHKVSYTLQASTYPFMALIALQSNVGSSPKMTVIERMEGPSHPEELVSQIEHAMDRHGAVVHRLKNEREQREQERQLRVDQDAAYHESLKADQEKARKAQEEKEAQQEQERQKQLALEAIALQKQKREQYIQYLYGQLPDEPTEGPMAKLSFRLADGDRVIRTFKQDATVDTLYQFVQVYPFIKNNQAKDVSVKAPSDYQHQYKFTIHSPYPRMEYEPSSKPLIDIKSLWPSATLVVEEEEEEEEEE
ncbi:uncharacterized protein B0P05DRAFT_105368 [Gilbertella persicaria]|uniref:uncharacterized protein n=1 Tax=Gilbertella persicaria TaxID=101096 RepID=UPI00221F10DF|nr:uncharacterized protein B0P05DRAFT_105368 [Gilbertella persicaria]KAI8078971.1 hypothetical protein B0P05DRAFT_105368 [Gilbertella persicaria]